MGLIEESESCPICGAYAAQTKCQPGTCRSAAPEHSYPADELVRVRIIGGGLPFWPAWMRALGAPYGVRAANPGTEVLTLREFLADLATAVRLVPGSTLQELALASGLFGDVTLFAGGDRCSVRSWDPAWIPIIDESAL